VSSTENPPTPASKGAAHTSAPRPPGGASAGPIAPPPRRPLARVLLGEIGETLAVLLVATLVMHVLLYLVVPPGDGGRSTLDCLARYAEWAGGVLRLDLGQSPYSSREIRDVVAGALPTTAGLLALGLVTVSVGHLAIGYWSTFFGGTIGRALTGLVGAISLVPVYLIAFRVRTGPGGTFARSLDGYEPITLLLLIATLAGLLFLSNGLFAESMGTLKTVLAREAAEPYVRSLKVRRIPVAPALLRNGSALLLGALAAQLPRLVTVVFILEWAFNLHGIGYEGIRAFDYEGRRDVPVILAMTLFAVLLVRGLLFLQRILVARLNPALEVDR